MKLIDILKTNADSAKSYIENIIADRIEQKQDKLTFDTTPTADSQNPVTSDGIKKAIDAKTVDLSGYQTKLTFDTEPTENSTNPVTSDGVKKAIDASSADNIQYEKLNGNVTNSIIKAGKIVSPSEKIPFIPPAPGIVLEEQNSNIKYGSVDIRALGEGNGKISFSFYEEGGPQLSSYTLDEYGNFSGNAATSTKATQDAYGNVITDTYITKTTLIASLPACYERSTMWSAAKNVITVPDYITVNIGNNGYVKTGASTIDVNTASNWDNSTYATSANRAGKDFYIYACQASGTVPKFVLSANSTVPTGYTATNSRKIGGFHCECADVGTIEGHPLSGYIAGDILPRSIWDLKHRPVSSPEGMVWCDGVWVDIYLAGWDGSKLVSQYKAVIQDGDSTKKWHGELFNEEFHKIKKRLLWRDEFATYAKGSNEKTNIAGSSDPNTTGGHKDTANRRMISNYGLEDCCGVLWQWTNDISMRGTITNGTDSDYTSSGNYWLNGYKWDSANRIGNSDIDGDKTKYGNEYGLLVRLIVGGRWGDRSCCGSRSVDGASLSAKRIGANAGRGASEPWVG